MRRFLNERNLYLLMSLVIATGLWGYVAIGRSPSVERATAKVVPVVPTIVGEPRFGYSLLGVQVNPATVSIRGDPRVLETVQRVTTEPINLSGATRDITQDVPIVTPQGIEAGTRVRVSIQIAPAVAITVLRGVRVQVLGAPAGTSVDLQPATLQVRVSGPVMLVTRLRADELTATLQTADLPIGQHTLPVRACMGTAPTAAVCVRGPAEIEVFDIQPAQLVVTIRRG
ncbi:MAG: CdaR family protein [bacterium]